MIRADDVIRGAVFRKLTRSGTCVVFRRVTHLGRSLGPRTVMTYETKYDGRDWYDPGPIMVASFLAWCNTTGEQAVRVSPLEAENPVNETTEPLRIPNAGDRVKWPNVDWPWIVRCASADGVCLEITHGDSAGFVKFVTLDEFHEGYVADTRMLARWRDECNHGERTYVETVSIGLKLYDIYVYESSYIHTDAHRRSDTICLRWGDGSDDFLSVKDVDTLRDLYGKDPFYDFHDTVVKAIEAWLAKKKEKGDAGTSA